MKTKSIKQQPIHDRNRSTQTPAIDNPESVPSRATFEPPPTAEVMALADAVLAGEAPPTPTPASASAASSKHVFKLGLDLDWKHVVGAMQCDHGAIKPVQEVSRAHAGLVAGRPADRALFLRSRRPGDSGG